MSHSSNWPPRTPTDSSGSTRNSSDPFTATGQTPESPLAVRNTMKLLPAGSSSVPTRNSRQNRANEMNPERDQLLMHLGELQAKIKQLEETVQDSKLDLAAERAEKECFNNLSKQTSRLAIENKELKTQLVKEREAHDKTRETVRVQSREITAMRSGQQQLKYSNGMSSQHFMPTTPSQPTFYPQQSSFELAARVQTPASFHRTQSAAYHNQSFERDTCVTESSASDVTNPYEGREDGNSMSLTPYKKGSSRVMASTTPAPALFKPSQNGCSSSALVQRSFYNDSDASKTPNRELMTQCKRLYDEAEGWAMTHANVPDQERDKRIPKLSWNEIYRNNYGQYSKHVVETLLETSQTRYNVVAKMILHRMTQFCFRPIMLREYDGTSGFINRFKAEVQQLSFGMPLETRKAVTTRINDLVRKMTTDEGWQQYVTDTIGKKSNEMWHFLEPLMPKEVPKAAYNELKQLWMNAIKIGLTMNTRPSWFSVDFPQMGKNSPFNPASMLAKDPTYKHDSAQLASMQLTVRYCWTPVVSERVLDDSRLDQPRIISFARVLLMP